MIDPQSRLRELAARGLRRRTRRIDGPQGPWVELEGRRVLLLCSNNYLGLAEHPAVREAAARAAQELGAGSGSARLVSGTMAIHEELEARLAAFEGREAALLFGAGYLANTGVVSALAGPGTTVFSDALNHASIIDGCRLARAQTFVYRHCDLDHLEHGLREHGGGLIVTDSVFSMDGDVAPLAELVALARRYGARLVVDEAHGTGAIGPGGRGACAAAGVASEVDVIVGTLGKALGSFGAYAACDHEIRDLLVNTARPFIFSTAPPPPSVAAALAALDVLEADPSLVRRLRVNGELLRSELAAHGLEHPPSDTQIVPIVIGDADAAVAACQRALDAGVFAQAIRPPTVPLGTARLRLAVMASHEPDDLRVAAATLAAAVRDAAPVVTG
jgi:8-amino-7-oxononanoate synthase